MSLERRNCASWNTHDFVVIAGTSFNTSSGGGNGGGGANGTGGEAAGAGVELEEASARIAGLADPFCFTFGHPSAITDFFLFVVGEESVDTGLRAWFSTVPLAGTLIPNELFKGPLVVDRSA